MSDTKKCTKCGEVKPLFEYSVVKKRGCSYILARCKQCVRVVGRPHARNSYNRRKNDPDFKRQRKKTLDKFYSEEHNREKKSIYNKERRKSPIVKQHMREKQRQDRKDLRDYYVCARIRSGFNFYTPIPVSEIPAELIEAKRQLLKVKRKLR